MTVHYLVDGLERVYFIKMNDLIKIGYTQRLKYRLAELRQIIPYHIELIFEMPGNKGLEALFHRRFKKLNFKGEWFRSDPEIFTYIKNLEQMMYPDPGGHGYFLESPQLSV